MIRRFVLVAATTAGATLLTALPAAAQPSGQDIATAQALFEDGKRLLQQGKYDEACPKLVESQRLDPGGGTLLAIALCHEGEGKTATAWADFNVALGQARKDGRADREATASEHIKALEPKLTRVRVSVTTRPEGLEVRRDGTVVGEPQWGTALPVDPGDHVFEATAPAKVKWSATISVRGDGQTIDVRVPELMDDGAAVFPAPATAAPPAPPPRAVTADERPAEGGSSQRVWAGIAGGVGVVATAAGVVLGLSASAKWNDAEEACPGGRCRTPADQELGKDAGTAADLSTVFFTVGAVGLVAGAVLYFTAPASPPARSSAARRLLLEGTF